MDKKSLTKRDIRTKYITPALKAAGWDEMTQIREEVSFTKGRIMSVENQVRARQKLYREFSPGSFDLIGIDEWHRDSIRITAQVKHEAAL